MEREKVIKEFADYVQYFKAYCIGDIEDHAMLKDVLALLKEQKEEIENLKQTAQSMMEGICLLKEQEAREPHYTTLRYLVNGKEVVIKHPECPRCVENGLLLWDAEIKKGQAYCKRCGQAVKWDS